MDGTQASDNHPAQTLREQYIEHHRLWLAPYAVAEADCGMRAFPESPHDYRTEFQRDRDRIIHCSAFRRLDYKTQVFVPHEQDHFRTRLTHTLEVAQVARNLARALRVNEDLCEAVALAHDLGHPPFGHAGEFVLAELMAAHGHFEHNRQSLRVVDYLEHPYPAFRGLNLTFAVRESLAKHTTRYDTPAGNEFRQTPQASVEGQLVDASDEIAYTSADLEDALQAGWILREQLAKLDLWQLAWQQARQFEPEAREIHVQIRATKAVLAILADDLVASTLANLAAMKIDSLAAARNAATKCVGSSRIIAAGARQLQDFLLHEVYTNDAGKAKEAEGRRCITGLFERFVSCPETLPDRYRRRIEDNGVHRVACDYIAGMTDRFCKQEFAKLCRT